MSHTATLLIELRTEELPPKALAQLSDTFAQHIHSELIRLGFMSTQAAVQTFATPRRLAVSLANVQALQPDQTLERKGPAVNSALDAEGKPTKALEGFLRSTGLTLADLTRRIEGKAEYFVAAIHQTGTALSQHLAQIVETALKKLPIPKLMRWGNSDIQFVRPVHGLVMLHGEQIITGQVLGLSSGRTTLGHRFLSHGELSLPHAEAYADTLRTQGYVMASFQDRQAHIAAQLAAAAEQEGARLVDNAALLAEVTALVEWPVVYVGEFEEDFLRVPQECLILTMQQNQKYFPLLDEKGKLRSRFLIVSNLATADPQPIIQGNARVVRARLADARFFFDQDRKTRLDSRVAKLAQVIYHNQLGTQAQRVERLVNLAGKIAAALNCDVEQAQRAAYLAKADLVSDMVGEFPELQGIMGQYYAAHDGETSLVAQAIAEHYYPRFAGDRLPSTPIATAVALADKLDTLVGIWSLGQIPTGDKDPFALRRHALGVMRMLVEQQLPISPAALLDWSAATFPKGQITAEALDKLHTFLFERLRNLRKDRFALDEIDAVLAVMPPLSELDARLAAVQTFRSLAEASALAAANKRIQNILKKAEHSVGKVKPGLLREAAEQDLYQTLSGLAPQVEQAFANKDFVGTLKLLAGARQDVDHFFTAVMVNAPEADIRANRLNLLLQLAELMNRVADISRLASA